MGLRARERLRASERERSGEELSERWVAIAGNGAESTWEERSSRYGAMFKACAYRCSGLQRKVLSVSILTMNFDYKSHNLVA